jgi:tetratricopeptide (TPR) repeat protein
MERVAVTTQALTNKDLDRGRVLHAATIPRLWWRASAVVTIIVGCATTPHPSPGTRSQLADADRALAGRDYDVALADYDRAVESAPDTVSEQLALRERAEARLFMGDAAGAAVDLARLTVIAPRDPRPWHDLGIVRANIGDHPGATIALVTATSLAPDDPRPRIALAALRWADGDREGARRDYQVLLTLELPDAVRDKVRWALEQLATADRPPP